jgi:uncharacterized protein DUF2795
MNLQRAAEIQVVLEGIGLPATRDELVSYAAAEDREAASALRQIEDRTYGRIDEVGEQLAATQPLRRTTTSLPRPESGEPPGGADYVRSFPAGGGR